MTKTEDLREMVEQIDHAIENIQTLSNDPKWGHLADDITAILMDISNRLDQLADKEQGVYDETHQHLVELEMFNDEYDDEAVVTGNEIFYLEEVRGW